MMAALRRRTAMNQIIPARPPALPEARPADLPIVAEARPVTPIATPGVLKPPVDTWAIASAICGLTAIVPVISQVAGIILGIIALRRIRHARREGFPLKGVGWAVTGIGSSVLMLLCWLFIFAAFGAVIAVFSHTTTGLDKALSPHPS
jgi:hypothetical protein